MRKMTGGERERVEGCVGTVLGELERLLEGEGEEVKGKGKGGK